MPDDHAPTAYDLAVRPGFLIRRLHQIHVALFIEECGAFDVTPVQYSIMTAVQAPPGLDQARLRSSRSPGGGGGAGGGGLPGGARPDDRRLRLVEMTAAGADLLGRMDAPARRAHTRTVAALPPAERRAFVHALARLVQDGNAHGRAPLRLG